MKRPMIALFLTIIFIVSLSIFVNSQPVKISQNTKPIVLYLSEFLENGAEYKNLVITPHISEDVLRINTKEKSGKIYRNYLFKTYSQIPMNFSMADSNGNLLAFEIKNDIENVTQYMENFKQKDYIVEFNDEPLLVKQASLEQNPPKKGGFSALSATAASHKIAVVKTHDAANIDIKKITGKTKGSEIKQEFSQVFNGMAVKMSEHDAEEVRKLPYVKKVNEDRRVKAFLNESVPQANAPAVWARQLNGSNITGKNITIAIIDTGVDYMHGDFGTCNSDATANGSIVTLSPPVESDHPYSNNFNYTWIITKPGFTKIAVHFKNISIESYFERIRILDANDTLLKEYSQSANDVWSPSANGDTIKVRFTSDYSVTYYGFYIDKVINGFVNNIVDYKVCSKVKGGWDFANNDNDPRDDQGHGTHVAAIAAGNGTLKGAAPDANILAYKVLDKYGSGRYSNVIAGIERAVSDGADIISMSLGGYGDPDDSVSTAVDNAVKAGVISVIAAGNSGPEYRTVSSPGTARLAITVGAVNKTDDMAYFSSRGPVVWSNGTLLKPDVVAPGVDICAARASGTSIGGGCIDGDHISISGTSMATPHVAGFAALLMQAHPDWSATDVKSAIMGGAQNTNYSLIEEGAGRIDAYSSYNVSILYNTTSISNYFPGSEYAANTTIFVKNTRPYSIDVNVSASSANDESGAFYSGVAIVSPQNFTLQANSNATIEFEINTSDAGGVIFGRINLLAEEKNHTIPYIASRLSQININVSGGNITDSKLYPDIYIHDDNMSFTSYMSQFWDIYGNSASLIVPSNKNYTIYALGDYENISLSYILMDRFFVQESANITINLSNSRKFGIRGESFKQKPLKLYEWEWGFLTYKGYDMIPAGSSIIGEARGNISIYISNKPDNNLDTDITLRYFGVPVR